MKRLTYKGPNELKRRDRRLGSMGLFSSQLGYLLVLLV